MRCCPWQTPGCYIGFVLLYILHAMFFVFVASGWMALGCVPSRFNMTRDTESTHQLVGKMVMYNESVYPIIADIYSQSKFL